MKVLVAEDDPVSRRLLQSYLERWGHEVVTAENGTAAWALFENENYPIVISDWMMPEMDGLELIGRIRALVEAKFDVRLETEVRLIGEPDLASR